MFIHYETVPEEYTAVDDNLVTSAKITNDGIVEDIISSRQHNNDESDNEDEEPPSRPSMTTVFAALDYNTIQYNMD
jgi:hypothetical protein